MGRVARVREENIIVECYCIFFLCDDDDDDDGCGGEDGSGFGNVFPAGSVGCQLPIVANKWRWRARENRAFRLRKKAKMKKKNILLQKRKSTPHARTGGPYVRTASGPL
jgi:hypothetical protein